MRRPRQLLQHFLRSLTADGSPDTPDDPGNLPESSEGVVTGGVRIFRPDRSRQSVDDGDIRTVYNWVAQADRDAGCGTTG